VSIVGDSGVHAVVEHLDLDLERSDISCIDGNASGLLFVVAVAKNALLSLRLERYRRVRL